LSLKRGLLVAGLLAVALAGAAVLYVVWFLGRAAVDDVRLAAVARRSPTSIDLELTTSGSDDGVVVTVIDTDRTLRDALGLAPPAGFEMVPLALEESEKGDPQMVEFVARYNREKARYEGRLAVGADGATRVTLAAERPQAASGWIQLQYERRIGMGGSMRFVSVPIGTPPSPPAPGAAAR
jgi:hypothetical protein